MSSHVIAVDIVALLLALIGFHMAFRQSLVRRLIGGAARPRPGKDGDEDPVHYALMIFGMMILAFGIILFGFTTFYALLTR
jgi:formate hydrogenlyase subunit 3/multisubunit Na+/H+ antiporter MnhD subunit